MDKNEFRNTLIASLQEMYDMKVNASLMEFCQGELRVLMYMYANQEKDVFPSDLSDSLCVTKQRVTNILTTLRKKNYISMEIAENDRRRMKVNLTGTGRDYIVGKQKAAETYVDALIDGLGETSVAELTGLIGLAIQKMKEYTVTGKENKN